MENPTINLPLKLPFKWLVLTVKLLLLLLSQLHSFNWILFYSIYGSRCQTEELMLISISSKTHEIIFEFMKSWFLNRTKMSKTCVQFVKQITAPSPHSYATQTNNQPQNVKMTCRQIAGWLPSSHSFSVCRTFMRHESHFSSVLLPLSFPAALYPQNFQCKSSLPKQPTNQAACGLQCH